MKLTGNEAISTFGGEAYLDPEDDFEFREYGLDFEKLSIRGLSPKQMIQLVCTATDHLILCGHRFAVEPTGEQDQRFRLVYKSQ